MLTSTFKQFRAISIIEGLSYLILLFIAMPLKYFFDMPIAVKIVGMTHGVLFILFCIALFRVSIDREWKLVFAIKLFIYSLVPFLFILIEKELSKISKES